MTVTMPLWVLGVALLATAGGAGVGTHLLHRRGGARSERWLTHRQQQWQANQAAYQRQLSTTLGSVQRVITGDVVAGSDLPPRDTGIGETAVLTQPLAEVVDAALDVEPTPDADVPRDEQRVIRIGRRNDDTGGTPVVVGGQAGYRHEWPVWRGLEPAPKPAPWRAPIRMLHTRAVLVCRRAVGRWEPADGWQQRCDRWRIGILAAVGRYRAVGRHAHAVLSTRSWSEVADERAALWAAEARMAAAHTRRLIQRAAWPQWGGVR